MLAAEDSFAIVQWCVLLRPIQAELIEPLRKVFLTQRGKDRGEIAAYLLGEYSAGRTDLLSDLILAADPSQLRILTAKLPTDGGPVLEKLRAILDNKHTAGPKAGNAIDRWQPKVNAALAMLALGRPQEFWPMLAHRPDPGMRTLLIDRLGRFGIDPVELIEELDHEVDPSIRQALILSLGGFEDDLLPPGKRSLLAPALIRRYRDDPDLGVHAALDWLLHRWSYGKDLGEIDRTLTAKEARGRGWYVDSQGHTMVIIDTRRPFATGDPPGPVLHAPRGFRGLNRTLAVASKEVTVAQYLRFRPDHPYLRSDSPELTCPINQVSWFDAIRYCRWLSEQEHIPEDQMCYPPIDQIQEKMELPSDILRRTGYRLPTELEWQFACRAGTTTEWPHGDMASLLGEYAWYSVSLGGKRQMSQVGQLKPNEFGLFDMLGNVYEWALDVAPEPVEGTVARTENVENFTHVLAKQNRILRGGAIHQARRTRAPPRGTGPAARISTATRGSDSEWCAHVREHIDERFFS